MGERVVHVSTCWWSGQIEVMVMNGDSRVLLRSFPPYEPKDSQERVYQAVDGTLIFGCLSMEEARETAVRCGFIGGYVKLVAVGDRISRAFRKNYFL